MIAAIDLRIGNIIQHGEYNSLYRILCFLGESMVSVDTAHVNFPTDDEADLNLSECNPVSLTEKLFLKFELPRTQGYDLGFEWHENKCKVYYNFEEIECNLDYVHLLQNLFYAIKGRELILK